MILSFYSEPIFRLFPRELYDLQQKNEHEICVPVWCHEHVYGIHRIRPQILEAIIGLFSNGRLEGVRWIIPNLPTSLQCEKLKQIAEQYGCDLEIKTRSAEEYHYLQRLLKSR